MSEKSKGTKGAVFQSPRGTRDFYPELMARINWLFDNWRETSRKHGFEEYDGPIYEHLDLYTVKSGEAIVSELFHFEDRGGRRLALRPELTPTLARMIAAKASSLRRPIKWFSIPRACRAERPQRGRTREFFQWNVDVVGSDSLLADAECIFVMLDSLRSLGLMPEHIELRVNSRTIVAALLEQAGMGEDRHEQVFAVMDKYEKLGRDKFRAFAVASGMVEDEVDSVLEILKIPDLEALENIATSDESRDQFAKLKELHTLLTGFGVGDYFVYRPNVVRGLAYYTGIVFEVFDRSSELRAVAGGGRYDKLIEMFGGPSMPAVGFGMGDVVLSELLDELGMLPVVASARQVDFFVIDADSEMYAKAVELVGSLRSSGMAADISYKRQGVGKQIKQANSRGARMVVILGEETKSNGMVTVKNMSDGTQREVAMEVLTANPAEILEEA